ncbi:lysophospholipid acyltransferase family protein [Nocardia sp. CDC160]|uniref:lysophospholipid acyltransferase family protein n=1 Tax=Nocardia sp. CDC160 TaxID=3112166 RepID=UPI002DB9A590|nr:lysophospholipid acyltransferase family protein [Nocardia sp. CDC160]MEC3914696.1 lysophospholipid acyltransferase family protein [Nocardia sp. CDC160]
MSRNDHHSTENEKLGGLSDGAPLHVDLTDTDRRIIDLLMAPSRAWFSPRFYGMENFPDQGPVLLVGNHSLAGGTDAPLLAHEILVKRDRLVRGLAENVLIDVPGLRDVLQRWGIVRGNRHNCTTLLEQGEAVAVFPGGGREAMRGKGQKYKLLWEGRTGFAKMAIQTGAPIVPTAMVGGDDIYDIVFDGDHPVMLPLRKAVEGLGLRSNLTPPLIRGLGPTLVPKPERFYYALGTPIDTSPWRDAEDLEAAATDLQVVVKKALEEELDFLLAERDRDRGRSLLGRTLDRLGL